MRNKIKKVVNILPLFAKKGAVHLYEKYFTYISIVKEMSDYKFNKTKNKTVNTKKKILIYHISGLSFGGTEKNLQSLANSLCDEYDVYFLFSNKNIADSRVNYVDKRVSCIEFDYIEKESRYPFYIRGMNPHIKNVISENNIDLLITADSGYTQYPINTIARTPIIMINIFGSPTLQKNIAATIFISDEVKKHAEVYTGEKKGCASLFIPIAILTDHRIEQERGQQIRKELGILDGEFVFGRIGRNTDSIFDPIGIRAFQKILKKHPRVHYIIMSPPPALEKIVEEEHIENVHFIPPSSRELDIWGFHYSLDCLAHFRNDGETFGLNIAESMYAGNPIISHKSHIWNAHLEYLSPNFARVAEKNDIDMYAAYMEEFITIKEENSKRWGKMKASAHDFAKDNFSEKKYGEEIKKIIKNYFLQTL